MPLLQRRGSENSIEKSKLIHLLGFTHLSGHFRATIAIKKYSRGHGERIKHIADDVVAGILKK